MLAEVRRITRQLKADRKVTMSRALRFLRDLSETLLITTGDILPNNFSTVRGQTADSLFHDDQAELLDVHVLPTHASTAAADKDRDHAPLVRLRQHILNCWLLGSLTASNLDLALSGKMLMLQGLYEHHQAKVWRNQISKCSNRVE